MSGIDDFDDWESGEDALEQDYLEGDDDEILSDQYNRNHVATREVDEQTLADAVREFADSPFLQLMKDVAQLRQLYGPSDPTINDLAEEIESGLRVISEEMRSNPLGFILEVAARDISQLTKAKKVIEDLLQNFPKHAEGGETAKE